MSTLSLRELLGAAEDQYRLLLEEATALLRDFDGCAPEDFDNFVTRRGEIMETLQKFDANIGEFLTKPGRSVGQEEAAALEAFRYLQEETTRRILEIDSLVIALARERLEHLQQEMGALNRGKTALHGYETSGRERNSQLNSMV